VGVPQQCVVKQRRAPDFRAQLLGTPRADFLRPREIVSEVMPLLEAFEPPK